MKKGIAVLLVMFFVVSLASVGFAASDINEAEQAILNRLQAGVEVNGEVIEVPEEVIQQAEMFFQRDDVNFTNEDRDAVIGSIDEIDAEIKAQGVTEIADLGTTSRDRIIEIATSGAEAVQSMNLTLTYDPSENLAQILDAETGDVLGEATYNTEAGPIKQTGFALAPTALITLLLTGAVVGSIVTAKKKNLFGSKA